MKTYYVTVWADDGIIEPYTVNLAESEKANAKTFSAKLHLKYWHTILAWSLVE
jgi:hypothetical protein